jgi:hypothetical protein
MAEATLNIMWLVHRQLFVVTKVALAKVVGALELIDRHY